jgi:hypothetical protein
MPTTVVVKPISTIICVGGRRESKERIVNQCVPCSQFPSGGGLAMNETLKSLDFRHLQRRLGELEIDIVSTDDGKFLACSYSEPLFCIERDSEEDAKIAVVETLESYIRTFYKTVEKFRIGIQEAHPIIPHQFVRPISKLRPEFEDQDGGRYAVG